MTGFTFQFGSSNEVIPKNASTKVYGKIKNAPQRDKD